MSQQQNAFPPLSDDTKYNIVAGSVAAVTMVLSIVAFWWIWLIVQPPAPKPIPESAVYNNYDPAGTHLKPESLAAMQKYITENEQPQNVQILKGWNTKQISNYMVAQVAGGLKVDCSYCHNINNFADLKGKAVEVNVDKHVKTKVLSVADSAEAPKGDEPQKAKKKKTDKKEKA